MIEKCPGQYRQWLQMVRSLAPGRPIVSVDASLTGCSYAGLNCRYTGIFYSGFPIVQVKSCCKPYAADARQTRN